MNRKAGIHIVFGPTASGKTAMAIQLAETMDAEIISFDSRQFYREIPIGTAQPSLEEQKGIPHHCIGCISVENPLDAHAYSQLALPVLSSLLEQEKQVVLVGGSGFYLQALLYETDTLPGALPEMRETWTKRWVEGERDGLIEELKKWDPKSIEYVDIRNPARVIRALEILFQTGKPLSEIYTGQKKKRFDVPLHYYSPSLTKEEVSKRIFIRLQSMLEKGLEQEAMSLFPLRNLSPLRTVGYSEWYKAVESEMATDGVPEQIYIHTLQYAKRQRTWQNKFIPSNNLE
jgi:tRNA dimethylallyltransferase